MRRVYDWCRFPRMKCVCSESTTSYERLNDGLIEIGSTSEDKDFSNEKEEELCFYNDDGSYQMVVVEKNLCASDLCQLLAVKNRVAKSVNWSIVEHWNDLGAERLLEDHEYVLSAYRDMNIWSRHADVKFVFRKEYRKYEFFRDPQQFFPTEMIDVENHEELRGLNINLAHFLQNLIQEGKCPLIFSQVWVRDQHKQIWRKAFLLLRDKKLYLSFNIQLLTKIFRCAKNRDSWVSV
ncbi:Ras association (RalGDS/AF-6) domain [Popillia japonica]|uniref:Ras association (RalGDS/AF-6) domain n=1 Tax=Popillia japonica TaxID=7064 RepID=A0AAW1JK99_POPJA